MATWGTLKSDARSILFPSGEASNLVAAHDAAFLAAIIDLQQWCDCLQQDNTSVFPQCATFYNCGITTFDAPRGRIKKISVVNSKPVPAPTGTVLFSTTLTPNIGDAPTAPASIGTIIPSDAFVVEIVGQGSSTKPVAQYFLVTVSYTDVSGTVKSFDRKVYVSDQNTNQTQQISNAPGTQVYVSVKPFNFPVATSGSANIVVNVRNFNPMDVTTPEIDWCSEIEYKQTEPAYVQKYWAASRHHHGCLNWWHFFDLKPPVPTDANVPPGLPLLPLGYHYPQSDTDKKHRAERGLWALERQKIYIVPWINSTEYVVVKWDGIKRNWSDGDPVDDDPMLAEAIRHFVRWDHLKNYERDYEAAASAQSDYNESRAKLIHECREETRVRGDEASFARQSNPAATNALFYNTQQIFTANCQAGSTGNPVTITISAGLVASAISQADADAKALAQAQTQAQAQLNCNTPPTTYTNAAQSYTAVCAGNGIAPNPDGTPQTVNIPAGQFTSTISQAEADAQALAAAQAQAQSLLSCTFWNSAQTYTAVCPAGQTGASVTKTVAAHTFSSTLSQADADAQALNSATLQANAALVCNSVSPTFYNTSQSVTKSITLNLGVRGYCTATVTVNVGAGKYTSTVSQAAANAAAINYANSLAAGTAQQRAQNNLCGTYNLNV